MDNHTARQRLIQVFPPPPPFLWPFHSPLPPFPCTFDSLHCRAMTERECAQMYPDVQERETTPPPPLPLPYLRVHSLSDRRRKVRFVCEACNRNLKSIAFLPCGHSLLCHHCFISLSPPSLSNSCPSSSSSSAPSSYSSFPSSPSTPLSLLPSQSSQSTSMRKGCPLCHTPISHVLRFHK